MAEAKQFWVHDSPTSLQDLRIISLFHKSGQLIWNIFTILRKEALLLLHLEARWSKAKELRLPRVIRSVCVCVHPCSLFFCVMLFSISMAVKCHVVGL